MLWQKGNTIGWVSLSSCLVPCEINTTYSLSWGATQSLLMLFLVVWNLVRSTHLFLVMRGDTVVTFALSSCLEPCEINTTYSLSWGATQSSLMLILVVWNLVRLTHFFLVMRGDTVVTYADDIILQRCILVCLRYPMNSIFFCCSLCFKFELQVNLAKLRQNCLNNRVPSISVYTY